MFFINACVLSGVFVASAASPAPDSAVDFNRDIRPILARNCLKCHGMDGDHRAAGLRLDEREAAIAQLESGEHAIVAGDPKASALVERVASDDPTVRMPPDGAGKPLSADEVRILRDWIAQGAKYAAHWSLVAPQRPALPVVQRGDWPRNGIDFFILSGIEGAGLQPAPEADRYTLIRRLSFDLRGLPPTPEEVDLFVRDAGPDAYDRLVDRFLADPAYGERWAQVWLDLARYADSKGYGSDPLRTIWRYRDWVIDAFNANMPYDQFTIEQLAGDLLEPVTLQRQLATAFHRNTMTNTEGGTDDEEFRVAAVRDRIDTTMQVWMGLTVGCAKCHSHKYDPITHREYYQLFAFFNQTADNDQPDDGPTIAAPTRAQNEQVAQLEHRLSQLRATLNASTPELLAEQASWEVELSGPVRWLPLSMTNPTAAGSASDDQPDWVTVTPGAIQVVRFPIAAGNWTAVRLQATPSENAVAGDAKPWLTGFSARRLDTPVDETGRPVRYVRVELPGKERILSLAEVEVLVAGENRALGGTATQSSTDFDGQPQRAIDGNTSGDYFAANSTTHTRTESNPWWEVDLGREMPVEQIVLWNRTDNGLQSRLTGPRVRLLAEDREEVWTRSVGVVADPKVALEVIGAPLSFSAVTTIPPVEGFVASALLSTTEKGGGWTVPAGGTQPEAIFFVSREPGESPSAGWLELRLQYGDATAASQFRVWVTAAEAMSRRGSLPAEVFQILEVPAAQRNPQQAEQLAAYYRSIAPALEPVRQLIAELEQSRPRFPTLPVMKELSSEKRRTTRILLKGNFLTPGETVEPAVPAALHPMDQSLPRNRLGLAQWIVDPNNPLTARVAVNRYWARIFGVGLVSTEEDFGVQGTPPSHPQLLDWLAVEFVENGWDVKKLLKQMVLSSTYRQSASTDSRSRQIDPRNHWLARAPRPRLDGEMIRDQALALSGLLSRTMHGPSVYPPQPDGLWRAAFNGADRNWPTSTGEDRYRRGLYIFWRRTIPYPSMATFDVPSRETCTIRRNVANTPLQAFVTLNDPAFVEAAQGLARRIVTMGGSDATARADYALRLCFCRPPEETQRNAVLELFHSHHAHFQHRPEEAMRLATEPLGPLPEGADPAELAAWTAVANVLLNADALLTKG